MGRSPTRRRLERRGPPGGAAPPRLHTVPGAIVIPPEHESHAAAIHLPVAFTAFGMALAGFLLAAAMYWRRLLDPAKIARAFGPVYWFVRNKWCFDEIYRVVFVWPAMGIAALVAAVDRYVIDGLANGLARSVRLLSVCDDWIDRTFVNGLVNATAALVYAVGVRLRAVETGRIRQYVLLAAACTVGLFVLISYCMYAFAAPR